MAFFLQLLMNGISLGFLYGISALGFILIYRSGGLLNFAHGSIMSFGAFLFYALSIWADWPIIIAFTITLSSSFILGLILERCFIRPIFLKENLIQKTLITLGLALMLKGLLSFFFGDGLYHLPHFIPDAFSLNWHHLEITPFHISVFAGSVILLIICWFFFTFSSQGLSIRAFAGNPLAARAMGVRVKRVFALSWAIAAILCAMSGMILGTINGFHSDSLSAAGLKIFPVIILGGLNSMGGAILGGIIIGLLETLAGGYVSQTLQDIVPYMALVLILIIKPSGFFGHAEPEKV